MEGPLNEGRGTLRLNPKQVIAAIDVQHLVFIACTEHEATSENLLACLGMTFMVLHDKWPGYPTPHIRHIKKPLPSRLFFKIKDFTE